MSSIEDNLKEWNQDWNLDLTGDEWTDQAEFCRQPYLEWKESLVDTFIRPHIRKHSIVMEIGSGHGRWTEYLVKQAETVILVDIGSRCLDVCRKQFAAHTHVKYILGDGKSLCSIADASIDFIWSYDSFVFMNEDVVEAYFKEFFRTLKSGGIAVIHHANRNMLMENVKRCGFIGRRLYQILPYRFTAPNKGNRSKISNRMIRAMAQRTRLNILSQVDCWGEDARYNCQACNDTISILSA